MRNTIGPNLHLHSPPRGTEGRLDAPPPPRNPTQANLKAYQEWMKSEGIPIYQEYSISDLNALDLAPWRRMGEVSGAHLVLKGAEGVNGAYLCEIPPGKATAPQRALFEETIFFLSGEGESIVWNQDPAAPAAGVRWQPGSILSPPINTWRRHINRGSAPARFVAITTAPVMVDLLHNTDFVFNNPYVFRDRYNGEPNHFGTGEEHYYTKEIPKKDGKVERFHVWDGGFVQDARAMPMDGTPDRGAMRRLIVQLSGNSQNAFIGELPVGTYNTAHYHGPGSHILVLSGKGYDLWWKGDIWYSKAKDKMRIDWQPGSLLVPPDGWYHQHFNTAPSAARVSAVTWSSSRWPYHVEALGGGGRGHDKGLISIHDGGNMIPYEDEDPEIRKIYEEELKKGGLKSRMGLP